MTAHLVRTVSLLALTVGISTHLDAQALPPVRPLGPVVRVSPADVFGSITAVRPLPGGRVLVNDLVRRQLLLLDSTFTKEAVVADTTAATANAFSGRTAGMIPYRGDSTLFIDPTSLSMLVIDGAGKVARVMAVPRPNDAQFMVGGPFGTPGFDRNGRIVYRGLTRPNLPPPPTGAEPGGIRIPEQPDSAPILRVSLATRALDTAAFFRIPRTKANVVQSERGMQVTMVMNPMPVVDDWALLPDGTLALVRGADYHVDWLAPDGTRTSTPKIPFEWQRMSDEAKVAFLDSAKTAAEAARARTVATTTSGGNQTVVAPPSDGGGGNMIVMRFDAGGPPPGGPGGPGGAGRPPLAMTPPALNMVPASELPDYRPAFGTGATRVDLDGNLWIRTSKVANGGPVYDVVNRQGVLVDRVALPFGRVIAGFGTGVVYMGVRDDKGARLELARVR